MHVSGHLSVVAQAEAGVAPCLQGWMLPQLQGWPILSRSALLLQGGGGPGQVTVRVSLLWGRLGLLIVLGTPAGLQTWGQHVPCHPASSQSEAQHCLSLAH